MDENYYLDHPMTRAAVASVAAAGPQAAPGTAIGVAADYWAEVDDPAAQALSAALRELWAGDQVVSRSRGGHSWGVAPPGSARLIGRGTTPRRAVRVWLRAAVRDAIGPAAGS